jgi:hypothetical protein
LSERGRRHEWKPPLGLEELATLQHMLQLNFQPVIPFTLTEDWHVIARTIVPIDSIPVASGLRFSGIGDIQEQIYITPAKPGAIIWGVGPVLSFPTATVFPTQTGSWAAGPARLSSRWQDRSCSAGS